MIILQLLGEMLPYMVAALIIFLITRFIYYRKEGVPFRKINKYHEIGLLLLILFVTGLASKTVLPTFYFHEGHIGVMGYGYEEVIDKLNLIPFNKITETQNVISRGIWSYFIVEVLGNIGMFIPIGFALPMLWKRYEKLWVTALTCLAASLFIELVQLITPLRATDVDDLIMNTLGGIIGYLIYLLIRRLSKRATDKWKLKPDIK